MGRPAAPTLQAGGLPKGDDRVCSVKVLVVDDDKSVRRLVRVALSLEGERVEVREASDGADALRVCTDFEPDVIFLDYWMPGMDGRMAAIRLRKKYPDARIVVFSGVVEATPEWADAHVVKGRPAAVERIIDLARHDPRAEAGMGDPRS
jgi:CheY-like chemotaxis protein